LTSLRAGEWDQLAACFPGATLLDAPDGSLVVSLPDVALPPGWSMQTSPVWFVTPIGYPAAQPDCFWASPDLRLASGAMPANAGVQPVPIAQHAALWFSWHLAAWRPARDALITYARFVLRRFVDAR
jgi:hypothetical protein